MLGVERARGEEGFPMDDNAANSLISQALVRHTPQAAVEHQLCLDLSGNEMNGRTRPDAGTQCSGVEL